MSGDQLDCNQLDVLVLPEGSALEDLQALSRRNPQLLVVGAAAEGEHTRAHALVNGRNQVDYLKICTDGRSKGIGEPPKSVHFQFGPAVVAVLICMDIQHEYRLDVKKVFDEASHPVKLLCIPADMNGAWFSSAPVLGWQGVHLALSNHCKTYPDWRARSLIAGTDGRWLAQQMETEPVVITLTA